MISSTTDVHPIVASSVVFVLDGAWGLALLADRINGSPAIEVRKAQCSLSCQNRILLAIEADVIHRYGRASAMFSFKGRISRNEYWYRLILQPIGFIILTVAIGAAFSAVGVVDVQKSVLFNIVGSALLLGYLMAFLASHSRRWHDLGMSGWWTLANFVPLGGLVAFFMCGCVRGDAGPNFHGPDPLETETTL